MHRTGIKTTSTAWKAALLPLHQRYCEVLWWKRRISEVSNLGFFSYKISECDIRKKSKLLFEKRSSFFAKQTYLFLNNRKLCFWFVTSRGHWEVKKRQEFTILWMFCPSNAHNSIFQSFSENKHSFTGRLSLCIVPESKPCQQFGRLRCYHYNNDTEKSYDRRDEFQKFQTLAFLLTNFLSVTSRKNQNFCLRSGVVFSLTRLICFSLIESCCFWFVTIRVHWEIKKRQECTILWMVYPSNAHNSFVQSFPENKYFFTGRLSVCIVPESEPCPQLGRLRCYHYANDTVKSYDGRDDFQKFQTLAFFLTNFLSVTSRKNQNYCLRSGVVFSLTRIICFSLIESCCFWFVTSRGHWEVKKRQEFTILWMFCPSNAHNSIVQSFPENNYSFTGRLRVWIVPESKPCQQLGRLRCYLYTNNAEKVYDQRDDFHKFQTLIVPYKLSECHIKKKPKLLFEKRSNFFAY